MSPEERKGQILETARRVFAEKGYHNTGIGDICREIRISRGTLYQYFENKQDLFRGVLRQFLDNLESYMSPVDLSQLPETFDRDKVIVFLTGRMKMIYRAVAREGDLLKIFYLEAGTLRGEVGDLYERIDRRSVELIEAELSILKEAGRLAAEDLPVVSRIILGGAVKISLDLVLDGSPETIDRVAESTARFLVGGLWGEGE